MKIKTANLGYPRIGKNRELKRALERYWSGEGDRVELETVARDIRKENWLLQQKKGIDYIPSNDFSLYDHVLDTAMMLHMVPLRYQLVDGDALDIYFAMARGNDKIEPLEMTKWFDTNYHYIVPELSKHVTPLLTSRKVIDEYKEAKRLGVQTRPVLLGPVSFLMLSKMRDGEDGNPLQFLDGILPIYKMVLKELEEAGAEWVQIDEPMLGSDLHPGAIAAFKKAYAALSEASALKIMLTSYFAPIANNTKWMVELPVDGIHIDVFSAGCTDLTTVRDGTVVSLGFVDGRNVWLNDVQQSVTVLRKLRDAYPRLEFIVATSCSLLHVPIDILTEENLDKEVQAWLAFADQKLVEVWAIANALTGDLEQKNWAQEFVKINRAVRKARQESTKVTNEDVQASVNTVDSRFLLRKSPFEERSLLWDKRALYTTTTIGSFPQTATVRKTRADYRAGKISIEDYDAFVQDYICMVIRLQEQVGLDVLVHGEPERNDMVQYFAEQLDGFALTANGWVQSYGSRCVRPPIIYGDVSRPQPMTVRWIAYAQSLTDKPVKGILTGPITMAKWSFVRDDMTLEEVTMQLALAIRDEVKDLEDAGVKIIQVDEPAFREGMPSRKTDRPSYIKWAVDSFKVATAVVKDETQIHTHMCYSEFNDIIDAIIAMDADVLLIEASRSNMELLQVFKDKAYPNNIGIGVYDIHSPRIPDWEELVERISDASKILRPEQLWVCPDCGLKTRKWEEIEPALKNMVMASVNLEEAFFFVQRGCSQ